jgi:hypothetical protein
LPDKSLGAFVRPLNGSMMFRVSAGTRLQTGARKWQPCAPLLTRSQRVLLIDCYEQNRRGVHSRPRSNARRRTHVLAAPKWYTVMPKPHLSYPHVAIDLDKEKLTSISTDARAGT